VTSSWFFLLYASV